MKAINTAELSADQPNLADEALQSPAVKQKIAEIRTHLPGLQRLTEAFGELHELLDADDRVADFDTWCLHEFGVVPELLREATERIATA